MRIFLVLLTLIGISLSLGWTAWASWDVSMEFQSEEAPIMMPLVLQQYTQAPGYISGKVFDASSPSRNPLAGAQVCAAGVCDTADEEGVYLLENIPDGLHPVTASVKDFHSLSERVLVKPFQTTQQDFALTPFTELTDVFMRIVLTWDATPTWGPDNTPNDLDAHMWLEAPDPPTHVDFETRGDCTTFPNTCLEVDYQYGFGPETMAIRQLESTVYYYGILNYYRGYPGVPEITQSNARVRLFQEEGMTHEFIVPTNGEGDFWYIFSLSSDGATAAIHVKNCITTYDGNIPVCPGEQPLSAPTGLKKLK